MVVINYISLTIIVLFLPEIFALWLRKAKMHIRRHVTQLKYILDSFRWFTHKKTAYTQDQTVVAPS